MIDLGKLLEEFRSNNLEKIHHGWGQRGMEALFDVDQQGKMSVILISLGRLRRKQVPGAS